MKNIFTKHPRDVNETYLEHMQQAFICGFKMVFGGFACLIHGVFPFIWKNTASTILMRATHRYITRMPCVENRMIELEELIQQKKQAGNISQAS